MVKNHESGSQTSGEAASDNPWDILRETSGQGTTQESQEQAETNERQETIDRFMNANFSNAMKAICEIGHSSDWFHIEEWDDTEVARLKAAMDKYEPSTIPSIESTAEQPATTDATEPTAEQTDMTEAGEDGHVATAETAENHENDQTEAAILFDRVIDSIGGTAEFDRNYLEHRDVLINRIDNIEQKSWQDTATEYTSAFRTYASDPNRREDYRQKAKDFYRASKADLVQLHKTGTVGEDVLKTWMTPTAVGDVLSVTNEYNNIQCSDYMTVDKEHNLYEYPELLARYRTSLLKLYDRFGEGSEFQGESPEYTKHRIEQSGTNMDGGTFLHFNQDKPRGNGIDLRCYISPDLTRDPSQALDAFGDALEASGLGNSLYFKIATLSSSERSEQRVDNIVIYKNDTIDDEQFRTFLQDFTRRCQETDPELLPSDPTRIPPATRMIAPGISIAPEPDYINDCLRYQNQKELKHSWTTFIDRAINNSVAIALKRTGNTATSLETPGFRDEVKKAFREFMIVSHINPDTMLPTEYDDNPPPWANLITTTTNNDRTPEAAAAA